MHFDLPKFLVPLAGLATGIFIESEFSTGFWLGLILAGIALLCWVVTTRLSADPIKGRRISWMHYLWIGILFTAIGSLDFNLRCDLKIQEEIEGKPLKFTALIKDISYQANGEKFKLEIQEIEDQKRAKIKCHNCMMLLKTDGFTANKGDIIQFPAKASKIKKYDENDYAARLIRQGIYYRANVREANITHIGEKFSLTSSFEQFKDYLIILIEKSSLDREAGDFLISILLGDKIFLPSQTTEVLNSAGMAHILALSGMHVAIMLSIFMLLLYPLALAGRRKLQKIIALLFIWVYVIITGASPSTVRAALMATILVGAFILERKNSSLNALLAAIFIILFINPFFLWDIGLQMSFLCVLSIILFEEKLNPIDHRSHPGLYKTFQALLITLVATIFTWVLTSYYFGRVPLMFLPTNLLLLPFLPLFVGFGALYVAALTVGYDFDLLSKGLSLFHDSYIKSADILSAGGESTLKLSVNILAVIAWIAAMLFLAYSLHSNIKQRKKISIISASLLFLISFVGIFYPVTTPEEKSLKFVYSLTKLEVHQKTLQSVTARHNFPRQSVATLSDDNFHILSVDVSLRHEALEQLLNTPSDISRQNHRFLLIGPGADFEQMTELIENIDFSKVLLHPGIGKNQKAELLTLLNELHWEKIYSLGEKGSLEFLL
ncbi:MAG: ComEC/Rec2 family competence protein [Muribaculaceae bacterium]|nr:ComEC/Rec2 family competence protein [Muribaculaceae bacterium]